MSDLAAIAQAHIDERERIKAILNHPEAQGREAQARHLALSTPMPAEEATALLATFEKRSKLETMNPLERHMAAIGTPGITGEVGAGGTPAAKGAWDSTVAKLGGKP